MDVNDSARLIKEANEAIAKGNYEFGVKLLSEATAILLRQAEKEIGAKKAATIRRIKTLLELIDSVKLKQRNEASKSESNKTEASKPEASIPEAEESADGSNGAAPQADRRNVQGKKYGSLSEMLAPKFLSDYYGQPQAVVAVKDAIGAARLKNEALPHILLFGSHGLGKTTFARIIANEMGSNFIEMNTSGITVGNLIGILKKIKDRDIVFIDEIHTIPQQIAETVLYSAMQDFKISYMEGSGSHAHSVELSLPRFTLIGATTDLGLLPKPLVQRAYIQCRLQPYSEKVIAGIIVGLFTKLGMKIQLDTAALIAKRCRNNPRNANSFVAKIADKAICFYAEKQGIRKQGSLNTVAAIKALNIEITSELTEEFYKQNGIDELGLETGDREYLKLLVKKYDGGPVSIDTLSRAMNESKNVLLQRYEDFLIRLGFVKIVPQGRVATEKAFEYLGMKSRKAGQKSDGEADDGKGGAQKKISADGKENETKEKADAEPDNTEVKKNEKADETEPEIKAVKIADKRVDEYCSALEGLISYPDTVKAFPEGLDEIFPQVTKSYDSTALTQNEISLEGEGTKRILHCDSVLEKRFVAFAAKAGYVTDVKAEALELKYDSRDMGGKTYFPDFVLKTFDWRIAVVEIKNDKAVSYHLNVEKYDSLRMFCTEQGYGYAQIGFSKEAKQFISLEQIAQAPADERLKQYMYGLFDERAQGGQPTVFTADDLATYEAQNGKVSEYAVHTLVLQDKTLKNTDKFGNKLYIEKL